MDVAVPADRRVKIKKVKKKKKKAGPANEKVVKQESGSDINRCWNSQSCLKEPEKNTEWIVD